MKKVIPVKYPVIDSLPTVANMLAIISEKTDNYLPWIYNTFVQLEICTDPGIGTRIDYCVPEPWISCPWVNYEKLSRGLIKDAHGSIVDFFINAINNGRAISAIVDKYYLSIYNDYYKREHMYHSIFVYGYDLDKKAFNIASFFPISNGGYSFQQCNFQELKSAYDRVSNEGIDWEQGVRLISYNTLFDHDIGLFSDTYKWDFNVDLLKDLLRDFISSNNSAKRFSRPKFAYVEGRHCFGVDCLNYMLNSLNKSESGNYVDHRGFYLLREYQKILTMRISYLFENQLIQERKLLKFSKKCEIDVELLLNQVIKYNICRQKGILEKVKSGLATTKNDLVTLLQHLLNAL